MAQTKIKSGQLDISGAAHGTDGQALLSNANGTMRWGDIQVAGPGYTSLDYPGTTTALNAAGGQTLIINGSGYDANTTVTFGTTSVSAISVLSATQLSVTTPALANGTYDLVLGNDAGGTTTVSNVIIYNATPSWTTAAGSLGSVEKNATANFTVTATEPDGGTITYAVTSGALPTGLSLNTSSGAITGTATPSISSNTTYNFTITATDDENQTNARAFSIEVTISLPSEKFEVITYTGNGGTQKIEGGKILRGAGFSGSNSYITTGYTAVSSTAASISLWVNINSYTNYGGFAVDSTGSGNVVRLAVGQGSGTSGNLWISMGNGSTSWYQDPAASLTSYGLNNWFHLVVTVDGTTVKLYINGSLINTFTSSISYAGAGVGPYYLGGWGSSLLLNGKLDQVRFFNKAVSSSEVTTLYQEDDYTSTTKSTTDIFSDGSCKALYELETNANSSDTDLTHWGVVSDAGGNNMSCRLNSVSSEFTYTAPTGYSDWGGAWDTTSEVNTGGGSFTYSENNKKINESGGFYTTAKTENGYKTGKYYFEVEYLSTDLVVGITRETTLSAPFNDNAFKENAILRYTWTNTLSAYSTTNQTVGSAASVNDVYGFAVNFTDGEVSIYKNNTFITSQNLIPKNFNGTATNITFKEGTKFSPDLVWIKQRTGTANHILFDSVRGAFKQISTSATYGQVDRTSADKGVVSFDTNGFTLKDASGGDYEVNGPNGGQYSGDGTYVAWCFNAGGDANTYNINGTGYSTRSAAGLTSGTIADSKFLGCSTNTKAGFSIIEYNGSGASAGQTIDTGLTSDIELMFIKNIDASSNWVVVDSHTNKYHFLNTTAAGTSITFTDYVDGTKPKLYDFATFIHYCFHSVAGHQKIGTYTGNGSANGPIVQTDFEPAFVMIKNTDGGDSWDRWYVSDNERLTDGYLYANESSAETSYQAIKMLSNGFEVITNDSGVNQSSNTYLYLAIAADPDITQSTQANSFGISTYTGNGGTQDIYFGFKPDLIWAKARNSSAGQPTLFDSVRGISNFLESSSAGAAFDAAGYGVTEFNDDGVTVTDVSNGGYRVNGASGGTYSGTPPDYVAWAWKAADHDDSLPTINTTGTIDSLVSANQNAGFSIVKYTGNETASQTVGHGLSSSPEIAFIKQLDGGRDWIVPLFTQTSGDYMHLNTSAQKSTDTSKWSAVSSTTFTVGADPYTNGTGSPFIAYCWHSVTGYSKIGSYTGTGATGNAITTGFRPRFIMIKSTSNAEPWFLLDSKRNPTNPVNNRLMADSDASESANSVHTVDFTNTGFTANGTVGNGTNGNGVSYIYMAFK